MTNSYRSRKWLLEQDPLVTHTSAYIFCHYGNDGEGKPFHFIRISDCDESISFYFSPRQIKRAIKFIDTLISALNSPGEIRKYSVPAYKYSIKREVNSYFSIRETTLRNRSLTNDRGYSIRMVQNREVSIMGDKSNCTPLEFEEKLKVLEEELVGFRNFLLNI